MVNNSTQINLYNDTIHQKKLKEFIDSKIDVYQFCTHLNKPLLITDIYEIFPSLANWTPNFLDEKVGDKLVGVNTSETDIFVDYHSPLEISLSDYSKQINLDGPNLGRRIYLSALDINKYFPELKSEILFDTLLPQEKLGLQWLWYGPKGNTTGLHYDSSDNFFMQLYGQKRWIISKPNSIFNLHPRSALSKLPAISDFNPLLPDFEKFPKAQKANFYDVTMNPGSILYMPAFWWHQVVSCNTVISVNIWCKTSMIKVEWGNLHLLPLFIRSLPYFIKSLISRMNI